MIRKVVLIRHGDAENRRLGQTDAERRLTISGLRALQQGYPALLEPLKGEVSDIHVWSSEAVRARETAEVYRRLGVPGPLQYAALARLEREHVALDDVALVPRDPKIALGVGTRIASVVRGMVRACRAAVVPVVEEVVVQQRRAHERAHPHAQRQRVGQAHAGVPPQLQPTIATGTPASGWMTRAKW